jgi:hypothetical protein
MASLDAALPEGTWMSSSSLLSSASSSFSSAAFSFLALFLNSVPSKFLVTFRSTVVKHRLYSWMIDG